VIKLKNSFSLLQEPQRLYGISNPIIALTGGIGSGKSTVGKLLIGKGLNLINADQLVHEIYQERKTINYLRKLAPQMVEDGKIDFKELRKVFFNNSILKNALESYLYQELPKHFIAKLPKKKNAPILYDIPLLFEKNLEYQVDLSVVISCSQELQIERVLSRDQSDRETTKKIISNQMSMEEKISKAHYHIRNDSDLEALKKETSKFFNLYFST
jgi:dephospho-CoA kinase